MRRPTPPRRGLRAAAALTVAGVCLWAARVRATGIPVADYGQDLLKTTNWVADVSKADLDAAKAEAQAQEERQRQQQREAQGERTTFDTRDQPKSAEPTPGGGGQTNSGADYAANGAVTVTVKTTRYGNETANAGVVDEFSSANTGAKDDLIAYSYVRGHQYATPYVTVAVDPRVIPPGSQIQFTGADGQTHTMIAEDTGAWLHYDNPKNAAQGQRPVIDIYAPYGQDVPDEYKQFIDTTTQVTIVPPPGKNVDLSMFNPQELNLSVAQGARYDIAKTLAAQNDLRAQEDQLVQKLQNAQLDEGQRLALETELAAIRNQYYANHNRVQALNALQEIAEFNLQLAQDKNRANLQAAKALIEVTSW
jgi:3D (Asp-Asp-Asp) domain-containing protein